MSTILCKLFFIKLHNIVENVIIVPKGGFYMSENIFSERLKKLRALNGFSQKDLADATQIPYNTIIKYESGDRRPNFDSLLKLSRYFNTSVDYLMGYSDYLLDNFGPEFFEELMEFNAEKIPNHLSHIFNLDIEDIKVSEQFNIENKEVFENSYKVIFSIILNLINMEYQMCEAREGSETRFLTFKAQTVCELFFKLTQMINVEPFSIEEFESLSKLIEEYSASGDFSFTHTYNSLDFNNSSIDLEETREDKIRLIKSYINANNENNQKALRLLESLLTEDEDSD